MNENDIARQAYQCAFTVHKRLGPGLLESAYEGCLEYEMVKSGLYVERQKALPLVYDEIRLNVGYRLDLLIEEKVIVELKAVEQMTDVHVAQLITYLKLSGCKFCLLINFNVTLLKDRVRRLLNNL